MPDIEIQAKDGSGHFKAHIVMPDITPAPVIILIQEIFGINQEMRDKCNHMADQGYIAIAPDLFWRIEPGIELTDSVQEQLERAFQLFGEFDQDKGMEDLQATLDAAKTMAESNGKTGCTGYCLGGKLAYRMAAETDIDASISYYGVGIEAMLDKANDIKKPLMLHIAGDDEFVPKDAQEKIKEAMLDVETAEVYAYPGMDHAFARGNGMHYNKEAAELADKRTADFLANALKG